MLNTNEMVLLGAFKRDYLIYLESIDCYRPTARSINARQNGPTIMHRYVPDVLETGRIAID